MSKFRDADRRICPKRTITIDVADDLWLVEEVKARRSCISREIGYGIKLLRAVREHQKAKQAGVK